MSKIELILIRHGETDWNAAKVFRGHEDVRLNATGIAQADATAEALKDRVFEAIYSSQLKRAYVTAKRIALPHEIEVREHEAFVDINYGTWQGKKESTVKEKYAAGYDKWLKSPASMKFPGGDSMKKAYKRINSGLREVLFTHGVGTIVIVSHRIPLKMMTTYLLKKKYDTFMEVVHDPCAMSIFEVENIRNFKPLVLNDSSHLRRLNLPKAEDF